MITRRELLRAIALGGGIVAGELWVPGARKVFIPKREVLMVADIHESNYGLGPLHEWVYDELPIQTEVCDPLIATVDIIDDLPEWAY